MVGIKTELEQELLNERNLMDGNNILHRTVLMQHQDNHDNRQTVKAIR
jgi:hypothetical protein